MNADSLHKIVDQFASKNILVIGDVVLDHYIQGKVERLNPEAPVPVLHARQEQEQTGGAGNVAKNAAMLGATTILIGVVGDDRSAERIKTAATKEGYTTKLITDKDRPTIIKTRFMVGSQQLLRVDYEETHNIDQAIEKEIMKTLKSLSETKLDGIVVSDYAKGTITPAVAEAVLAFAKERKIPVAADLKPSRAPFFKGVDVISPNLKEGHEFMGLNPLEQGGKQPEELVPLLSKKMDSNVYLTLGAGGVYIHTKDGVSEHVPQEHVAEVFDVSGAGDTFIMTLLLSLIAGASPEQAAMIANAAGAVVVGKIGSVGLTADELKDMLSHHHS